jgi:hypothetical protein
VSGAGRVVKGQTATMTLKTAAELSHSDERARALREAKATQHPPIHQPHLSTIQIWPPHYSVATVKGGPVTVCYQQRYTAGVETDSLMK